jgi:hypothetical protein
VTLVAKAQTGAGLARRDHFLNLFEDFALADRATGVRADGNRRRRYRNRNLVHSSLRFARG